MMKKIVMMLAAAMMTLSASAQDEQTERPQRPQMDKGEMARHRTEMMVQQYGLDEDQAAKLLELNTEYADKLPPMMMGPGDGLRRPQHQAGDRVRQRPDSMRRQHRPDSLRMQRVPREVRPMPNREEMQQQMEAYETALKEIMTEEQFDKFKAEQAERRHPRNS